MVSSGQAKPEFSKTKVNKAAKFIVSAESQKASRYGEQLNIVNNWRSSHAHPLYVIRRTLRIRAESLDSNAIVTQRLKRLPAIEHKLNSGTMNLTQMNDIGGCRAVLGSVSLAERLVGQYSLTRSNHDYRPYDYVSEPKPSGYRGFHLVFDYRGQKRREYDGLRIEAQIRSMRQHIWATAVETVEHFSGEALKSGEGDPQWLRFFALMGSYYALRENRPVVPDTSENLDLLLDEIRHLTRELGVIGRLSGYRRIMNLMDSRSRRRRNSGYALLQLDWTEGEILTEITLFRESDREAATQIYYEREQQLAEKCSGDVVLVSNAIIPNLKKAYPNYFSDTRSFLATLRYIMKG